MDVKPTATLTDLCVLAALCQGSRYLEDLCMELREVLGVPGSEVCQRLQRLAANGLLESFAWDSGSGERFYFTVTNLGRSLVDSELVAWCDFRRRVDEYLSLNMGQDRVQNGELAV